MACCVSLGREANSGERNEDSQESNPGERIGDWAHRPPRCSLLQHQLPSNLFQQTLLRSDLECLHPPHTGLDSV